MPIIIVTRFHYLNAFTIFSCSNIIHMNCLFVFVFAKYLESKKKLERQNSEFQNECGVERMLLYFNRICHLSKFYSFHIFIGVTNLLVDFQIIMHFMENGKAFCRKYNNKQWHHRQELKLYPIGVLSVCVCFGFHLFSMAFQFFHLWVHIRIVQCSKCGPLVSLKWNLIFFTNHFCRSNFDLKYQNKGLHCIIYSMCI